MKCKPKFWVLLETKLDLVKLKTIEIFFLGILMSKSIEKVDQINSKGNFE